MFNIIFSDEYEIVPDVLVSLRRGAGLSQRDLAAALGRAQSHVQRMETRQRPVELVEFCRIARLAGADPVETLRLLLHQWEESGCASARPLEACADLVA